MENQIWRYHNRFRHLRVLLDEVGRQIEVVVGYERIWQQGFERVQDLDEFYTILAESLRPTGHASTIAFLFYFHCTPLRR